MVQLGGFPGRILGLLLKTDLPLTPLAKIVLVYSGLTATVSATDAAIQQKVCGSVHPLGLSKQTTLIIWNKEMDGIMKIVKSLEELDLLIKCVRETIKNESKEQKDRFLDMLLGTLAASLLRSSLADKGVLRAGNGKIRAGQNF